MVFVPISTGKNTMQKWFLYYYTETYFCLSLIFYIFSGCREFIFLRQPLEANASYIILTN